VIGLGGGISKRPIYLLVGIHSKGTSLKGFKTWKKKTILLNLFDYNRREC
jgi:hypothetical protein